MAGRSSETQPLAAARIHRQRDGRLVAVYCQLCYSCPVAAEEGIALVRAGCTAFVRQEDAEWVLAQARETIA
jgi:hypothetical protein